MNHEARRTMNLNLRTNTGQGALIEGMEGDAYEPVTTAQPRPATDWNGNPYQPDTYSEAAPVRMEIVTDDAQPDLF